MFKIKVQIFNNSMRWYFSIICYSYYIEAMKGKVCSLSSLCSLKRMICSFAAGSECVFISLTSLFPTFRKGFMGAIIAYKGSWFFSGPTDAITARYYVARGTSKGVSLDLNVYCNALSVCGQICNGCQSNFWFMQMHL